MFQLTWQSFSRQPHIASLPISQQTKLYRLEEQRYPARLEYYAQMFVQGGGDSGGQSTIPNVITSPTTIASGQTVTVSGNLTLNATLTLQPGSVLIISGGTVINNENIINNGGEIIFIP
jgi:hypothetical protein